MSYHCSSSTRACQSVDHRWLWASTTTIVTSWLTCDICWHLLTHVVTICHNQQISAANMDMAWHGHCRASCTVPRPRTQADPAGPTPGCIHDSIHEPTIEPTWTYLNPLEPTWTCIVCICNICNCIVFETYRLIVSSFVITRPVVPLFRPSLICSVCTSKKWQKSENLKSRSKAVQSHLFPRHGIVSTALHFTSTWLS